MSGGGDGDGEEGKEGSVQGSMVSGAWWRMSGDMD